MRIRSKKDNQEDVIEALQILLEAEKTDKAVRMAECHSKLRELRVFIDDIQPGCASGEDQLNYLKVTTDKLLTS